MLPGGDVEGRAPLAVEPLVGHVGHHAHDLPLDVVLVVVDGGAECEPLADRVLVRIVAAGQGLAHDHHAWSLADVAVGEETALQEPDAHGGEVIGRCRLVLADEALGGLWLGAALRVEARDPLVTTHGQGLDRPCGLHPRQSTCALEQALKEGRPRRGGLVTLVRQIQAQGDDALLVEARVHRQHFDEAAEQEPRAHQQHQRQRHLGHDQGRTEALAACRGAGGATVREAAHEIHPRRAPRRQRSEHEARDERDGAREQEHTSVDGHLGQARQVGRGQGHEQLHSPDARSRPRAPPRPERTRLSVRS